MTYDTTSMALLIAAVGSAIGAVGTVINAMTAYRIASRVSTLGDHVNEIKSDVSTVRIQGNHSQELLLDLKGKEAYSRGKIDQATGTVTKT